MIPGFSRDAGTLGLMTRLAIGKVVDVHPEQNTIDVRLASDNRRLISVPVVGLGNSGNTGMIDLPIPDLTTSRSGDGKWDTLNKDDGSRDMLAVIGFADGAPVCLGFILPPIGQMTFPKDIGEEFKVERHASDVYETTDRDGNHEWYHPSGTYLRVAENPAHLDLTAKDYDKKWKIKRNKTRAPHVHLAIANAGNVVCDIHVDPAGNITIKNKGSTLLDSDGRVTIKSGVGIDLHAPRIDWN